MNSEDAIVFQLAKQLVSVGQKQAAYDQLCIIRANGNDYDPDLLLWLAFTTPSQSEAQQLLDTVARIAPGHPSLPAAYAHQRQQWPQQVQMYPQQQAQMYPQQQYMQFYAQQYVPLGPALHCPYCHAYAPVLIKQRVSTAGWVVFGVLLFFTIIFCWIGLLIKEDYRVCSYCGGQLG